ncbi:hypothetical protein LCGC14_2978360 [marine sediment metagenome]|uniref:Uncharacterized protein n=1 Tax=marine sediment metagenome TaxID=412755 RepID=A0A0F8X7C9_9ZZZZ
MESDIEPTTNLAEGEKFKLVDKDYLLIQALRDWKDNIDKLRLTLTR